MLPRATGRVHEPDIVVVVLTVCESNAAAVRRDIRVCTVQRRPQLPDHFTVPIKHILLEEEEHLKWGQGINEELADTPERRREAMEWQMHLEELLVRSGGVLGH